MAHEQAPRQIASTGAAFHSWFVYAGLLVIAFTTAACSSASSRNPVVNGDMEEWPEGAAASPAAWQMVAGSGRIVQSAGLKHTGDHAAMLVIGSASATVHQSVPPFAPTIDRFLSCSVWLNASRTKARLRIGDGRSFARSLWHPSDGRWYRLQARIPSGAASVDVAIEVSPTSTRALEDAESATYIDDVECHSIGGGLADVMALSLADWWDSVWLPVGNYWTFRSNAGNWSYPLIRTFDLRALGVFIEAAALAALLLWLTDGPLRMPMWLCVVVWYAGALFIQRMIGELAPDSIASLIESENATGYYTATLRYSFREFLSNYSTLSLPPHVEANMLGKVMFFYALHGLTQSTQAIAFLVILISNLGGLLMFAIARKLFEDNRVALYSMAFYLLIPGKICFFPLLNTVTPVFLLLSFYVWLLFLESRKIWYLAALGASLYWLLLFDPIPFALGLVFAAFFLAGWKDRTFTTADLMRVILYVAAAFLVVHACMLLLLGFNIFHAFQAAVRINGRFNGGRPYNIWVFGDLWEFFLGAGIVQSALVLAFAAVVVGRLVRPSDGDKRTSILLNPIHVLLLSYGASVFALDLLGLNRGETMRLWTFLTVFMAMIAAYLCALKLPKAVTYLTVILTVFQTTATIYTVGVVLH